jgi:hypothetical protein
MWERARLEHYSLIYPRGMDSLAYRYALLLENSFSLVTRTIGQPAGMGAFPVVLHPGNMVSNGMVAWSPRRMELLTTPSFSQQAERWERHLVVHESRHVAQMGKLMTGSFRPLYFLMGEQAAGLAALFVPKWFFEGDAVGVETALTAAGRGHLPEFRMTYRAKMLSGKFYSFDKWYLGSYKDYTGDFYALGYEMVSFARYAYGADVWKKTLERYAARPLSLPPFSNAFKHHTGIGFNRLFKETFDFLGAEWRAGDSACITPSYHSRERKQYTSYKYPQPWRGSVIAVRSGLSDIASLVALGGGKERRLAYMGSVVGRIEVDGNRVYWLENMPGIRWEHENSNMIRYYDLDGRRKGGLGASGRYISFAVDSSSVIASVFTEDGRSHIARLDKETGREYRRYPAPDNAFVKELAAGGRDTVYALAVGDEGINILMLDLESGRWEGLLNRPTAVNITSPVYKAGQVYFESGLEGINNIYSLDISSRRIYRLTSARFGAFQPALSEGGDRLFFADYQAGGYRVASLPTDSLVYKEACLDMAAPNTLAEALTVQEGARLSESELKPVDFRPQPYHKASSLFHIHSWAPIYYNVGDIMEGGASDFTSAIKPGAMLLSQNALNTAITQAGWYYSDGYHHGMADFLYKGLFPVIRVRLDYGGRAFDIRWEKNEYGAFRPVSNEMKRTRLDANIQAYLPINLTSGPYVRGVQPSVTYHYTNNAYQQYGKNIMAYFQYVMSEVRLYNYRRMAHRDILPRLGLQLRLQYLGVPFNSDNFSELYVARLTAYLPGLMSGHSLMLRAAYQYQPDKGQALYIPKQIIESARGYDYSLRTYMQAVFKADYSFPVASPDLAIGNVAYLRRLRLNLFYDHALNREEKDKGWATQASLGGDIIADWNAFRMPFPLTTGLRLSKPLGGEARIEALLSVNF